MTSSLVGSEMCIRDSPTTLSCQRQEEVPVNCLQHKLQRRYHEWKWAVSYTHLTLPTICSV
eukprot:1152282-Prorocentrum_lima.AAC.1